MMLPCRRADPADEAAVRRILENLFRAFEARDPELYARHFAEDADWENAFGGRARGRSEIQTFMSRVYPLFARSAQTLLGDAVRGGPGRSRRTAASRPAPGPPCSRFGAHPYRRQSARPAMLLWPGPCRWEER